MVSNTARVKTAVETAVPVDQENLSTDGQLFEAVAKKVDAALHVTCVIREFAMIVPYSAMVLPAADRLGAK